MFKRLFKPAALIAALLCTGTAAAQQPSQKAAEDLDAKYAATLLRPGTEAPDFALPAINGDTVRLSDFRGRYVVLDFWASWCPDCRKDAPVIAALSKTYAERGVAFVGVSFDTDRAAWQKAIDTYGITYTQVSPLKKWKTTDIYRAYGVEWIPSVYVIDPQGRVVLATVLSSKVADALARLSPGCAE